MYAIRSYYDFVVIFDKDGTVIARSNSNFTGDKSYSELFNHAIAYENFAFIEAIDRESRNNFV